VGAAPAEAGGALHDCSGAERHRGGCCLIGVADRRQLPSRGDHGLEEQAATPHQDAAPVVLALERLDTPGATGLVGELDDYLGALYPPEENFDSLTMQDIAADRGAFFVARCSPSRSAGPMVTGLVGSC
jgi:hypothetical protein